MVELGFRVRMICFWLFFLVIFVSGVFWWRESGMELKFVVNGVEVRGFGFWMVLLLLNILLMFMSIILLFELVLKGLILL